MSLWASEQRGADTAPSDLPEERKTPSLRAEVFALAPPEVGKAVEAALSDEIPLRTFTSPSSFEAEVSGEVGVAVLTTELSESRLETLLKRTISAASHARVLLVASNPAELIEPPVPHDEALVKPMDSTEFQRLVRQLYVRAYYEVTLERLYDLGVAARNREIQLDPEEIEEDDQIHRLRKSRQLMDLYLTRFRGYLGPEDLQAMESRNERLKELASDSKAGSDPSVLGLPDSCPDCNLDWTEWHGSRLRSGYRKIAADSWRCTQCGTVLSDTGQNDYHVR